MANAAKQRLEGKRIVITGGTSGIGLETAKNAIIEGAKVLITGSSAQSVQAALAELGNGVTGIVANVTDLEALDRLADATRSELGHVDVLFANAGFGAFNAIEDVSEAEYDKQFDVNVKGVFFTVQKLLPLMGDGGSVILTASAVNEKGGATASLYFATKAAVRSFARSLAAELAPRGIRVNAFSPGIVRTGFQHKSNMPLEAMNGFVDHIVTQVPLGREGTTKNMADAAVFLASDESAYMTAADLVVDGGFMNV
ncbi:MAG: SDR family oxidoreductase [Devosia sp.]